MRLLWCEYYDDYLRVNKRQFSPWPVGGSISERATENSEFLEEDITSTVTAARLHSSLELGVEWNRFWLVCSVTVEYPCGQLPPPEKGMNQSIEGQTRLVGANHCPKGECPWQVNTERCLSWWWCRGKIMGISSGDQEWDKEEEIDHRFWLDCKVHPLGTPDSYIKFHVNLTMICYGAPTQSDQVTEEHHLYPKFTSDLEISLHSALYCLTYLVEQLEIKEVS